MAYASGLSGSAGFAIESTYGTPVTVTQFVPIVSESLVGSRARLESQGILAGRRILSDGQWAEGVIDVGGDFQCELYDRSCGKLLRAMLGSVSTGAPSGGYYAHTITPGSLPTLTAQIGRPDSTATVQPYTYTSLTVASWQMNAKVNEIVTLGLTFAGQNESAGSRVVTDGVTTNADATVTSATAVFTQADRLLPISGTGIPSGAYIASVTSATSIELSAAATATGTGISVTIGKALTAVSYASGLQAISTVGGSASIDGSAVDFQECSISGDNGLSAPRWGLSSPLPLQPVAAGEASYSATIKAPFASLDWKRKYWAGDQVDLILTCQTTAGASLVVNAHGRIDDHKVNVASKDILSDEFALKFTSDTSTDAGAIEFVYTTTDSTP